MGLLRICLKVMLTASLMLLLASFVIPSHTHTRAFDRAFMKWYDNKTDENRKALEGARDDIRFIDNQITLAIGAFALINALALAAVARRTKRPAVSN